VKLKRLAVVMLAIFMIFAITGTVLADTGAAKGPQTWDVSVSKATDNGVNLGSSFPKIILIHEGDSVNFTNGGAVPETLTFLAGAAPLPLSPQDESSLTPTAQSGVKYDGKNLLQAGVLMPQVSFSITFTAVGAFPYYSMFVPLSGIVVVMPASSAIPTIQEQAVDSKTEADAAAKQAASLIKSANSAPTYKSNGDGTLTYHVSAGIGSGYISANGMFPQTIIINQGDAIEWGTDNSDIHWVTFNRPAGDFFANPPEFLQPLGGTIFDGTGYFHSGALSLDDPTTYKLTFSKPGTYEYTDPFHESQNVGGKVIVLPKNSVKLMVNGMPLIESGTHLDNNHVIASVAPFIKAIGGTVVWNGKLGAVVINTSGDHPIPDSLHPAKGLNIILNGKQVTDKFSPAPYVSDGRSYFSLQEAINLLGGSYSWDSVSQTLSVWVTPSVSK
jgi:plastocyanin